MERHEIEELLEQMGRVPVADPDDLTSTRIAQRWRNAGTSTPTGSRHHGGQPRRSAHLTSMRSRRVAVSVAASIIAVAASVALVAGVQGRSNDSDRLVVADATDVVVVLPNGESIEPLAGEQLPDGAVVEAGDDASGAIGAVEVSPRSRYIVRNGGLEPLTETTTTAVGPPPTQASLPATSTPGQAASSTSTPIYSEPKSPTTQQQTSNPPAGMRPARLAVRASSEPKPTGKGGRVKITWGATDRPEVRRYVVVRVRSWNGRTLPAGKRVASVKVGGRMTASDRNPKPGTFYVVAAIGPGNRVIAIGSVEAPVTQG